MGTTKPSVIDHEVRRFIVPLPLPYDKAVRRYEQLVPMADAPRFRELATWDAVLELAEMNAPHGFMIYWRSDITATMARSKSEWKCTEYLMGNHTIAERMFRHEPSVMLHAPLRTLIYADRDGDTQFAVDQPSTLFSSYDIPAVSQVGRYLDEQLAGLRAAMSAPVPGELRES